VILPCGVSNAPNRPRNVCRDEAIEKVAGLDAADLDHAAVGKKRCLHKEFSDKVLLDARLEVLLEVLFEVLGETPAPDITWQRKTLRYREQGPRDIGSVKRAPRTHESTI
jgi:hypothetical protein